MTRPPASLPPTTASNPLSVSLILGSFEHAPTKFEIFDLYLPESQPAPQHSDEPTFHPLPEIVHTFRAEQKVPPKFISAVFAGLAVAPWFVLLGLVSLYLSHTLEKANSLLVGTNSSYRASSVLNSDRPLSALHRCL